MKIVETLEKSSDNKNIAGFDGGLPANFLMELYNSENMELRSQVTNKIPIFEVNNIDPSVPIKLYLYAENAKGTSDPAIIDDSAQNQPKHNVEGKKFKTHNIS